MKVKALVQFRDYLENCTRSVGEEFEVTPERYDEILTKGGEWVEKVEDDPVDDLSKLKKSELEELAKDKGFTDEDLKKCKTKEDIIKMLGEV